MGTRVVEVPESRVVILEGIYALSQRIRCARHARCAALRCGGGLRSGLL